MDKKIKPGLKYTFLAHFIVALVFGLAYLLIPETYGELFGWPVVDPAIYRLLGAALLGYGTSSILAYRETAWEKVIIVVRMEIVWLALGVLAMLWGMIFGGLPAIGWLNTVLLAAFLVAFSIFYNPA
jgi:hypothetical protein